MSKFTFVRVARNGGKKKKIYFIPYCEKLIHALFVFKKCFDRVTNQNVTTGFSNKNDRCYSSAVCQTSPTILFA